MPTIMQGHLPLSAHYFPKKLTYKKTTEWKCELVCIASTGMIQCLSDFLCGKTSLSSNHVNIFTNPVTIPLLDSEITVVEVENRINKLKIDRASDPVVFCPGIFKVLPVQWLLSITTLFNSIFTSGCCLSSWRLARLFTNFKRRDPLIPATYLGINVMNTIAKLYDIVLWNHLMSWFFVYREQAGSHPKRGCIEHIVISGILFDITRKKSIV